MRQKTIAGIRNSNIPVFISLASDEGTFSLKAFQDVNNGALILAKSGKGSTAFSPISGKKMETMSVGEVASGVADMNDYLVIASCQNAKCKCKMYSTKEMASLLTSSEEKQVYCTACGQAMPVAVASDEMDEEDNDAEITEDEVGDESESDDPMLEDDSEESEDMEDSEEDSEDVDASEDMEDSEEDSEDSEDMEDSEDVEDSEDDSEEDSEDVDDSEDESEDLDEEVAKLLEEVASELEKTEDSDKTTSDVSDVTVAYVLHNVDLSSGKSRVIFHSDNSAWLTHTAADAIERQIGVFTRAKAAPESAKLYDRRDVFGKTVSHLIASGALSQEQPSAELTKLGFEPITVEVPLSVAQAKAVNEAAAAAKQAAVEQASSQLTDLTNNFDKLLSVAAIGMDKGVIGKTSLHRELSGLLERAGVRKADHVARQFCESKVKSFLSDVIAQAKELASREPSYVQGLAEAIAKATYASTDSEKTDVEQIATAVIPNTPISEVASLDRVREDRQVNNSRVSDALRRLGRRIG